MLRVEAPGGAVASDARYRALDRIITRLPMRRRRRAARPYSAPSGTRRARRRARRAESSPSAGGGCSSQWSTCPRTPSTSAPATPGASRCSASRRPLTPSSRATISPASPISSPGTRAPRPRARRRGAHPDAELVAEDGDWSLFRSRHPVVDLTAPDRALPSPPSRNARRADRGAAGRGPGAMSPTPSTSAPVQSRLATPVFALVFSATVAALVFVFHGGVSANPASARSHGARLEPKSGRSAQTHGPS